MREFDFLAAIVLEGMNKTISGVSTQVISLKNHILGRLGTLGSPHFESFFSKQIICFGFVKIIVEVPGMEPSLVHCTSRQSCLLN